VRALPWLCLKVRSFSLIPYLWMWEVLVGVMGCLRSRRIYCKGLYMKLEEVHIFHSGFCLMEKVPPKIYLFSTKDTFTDIFLLCLQR